MWRGKVVSQSDPSLRATAGNGSVKSSNGAQYEKRTVRMLLASVLILEGICIGIARGFDGTEEEEALETNWG